MKAQDQPMVDDPDQTGRHHDRTGGPVRRNKIALAVFLLAS